MRGGYGIFYGRTTVDHARHGALGERRPDDRHHAHRHAEHRQRQHRLSEHPQRDPRGRHAAATPTSTSSRPTTRSPTFNRARFGVEREIFNDTSLSVTYLYFHGVHLSRMRDVNLGRARRPRPPSAKTGRPSPSNVSPAHRSPRPRPSAPSHVTTASASSSPAPTRATTASPSNCNAASRAAYSSSPPTRSRVRRTTSPTRRRLCPTAATTSRSRRTHSTCATTASYADSDQRHRFVFSPVYQLGTFTRSDNPIARALFSDYTLQRDRAVACRAFATRRRSART